MKRTLLFSVAMAVALTPTLALADKTAQARESYRLGREAYKAGNYREALVHLKKAYKLKPLPALLRYTGETYFKLNQAQEAIKYYRAYIKAAPMAVDRAKVEAKVRQLELIVGPGDEEEEEEMAPPPPPPMPDEDTEPADTPATTPPPPPPPSASSRPAPRPRAQPKSSGVIGEDDENPLLAADRRRKAQARQKKQHRRSRKAKASSASGLFVAGGILTGVGALGVIIGGVMTGLANGKESELQEIVDANQSNGQPTLAYNKEHHDLVVQYDQFSKASIGGYVAGGVIAGAGIVLLIVGASVSGGEKADAGESRVVVAPVLGKEYMGLSGQVSF